MILFFSDIHLGRDDAATERVNERALIDCLTSFEGEAEHLYLVGDVFDQFIEYRALVPKGFVRFQGLLARWTDAGTPITYLTGNHDPWHRDYFNSELGVRIVDGPLTEHTGAAVLHLEHGDGLDPADRLYNGLKPILRHRIPVWMYTNLMPGDAGFAFARWVKQRGRSEAVQESRVQALRAHARAVLARGRVNAVVMGHSHSHELLTWPEGVYLNTGYWHKDRVFGAFDEGRLRLLRWNGTCTEEIQEAIVTQ